jgi:hypothetical protein
MNARFLAALCAIASLFLPAAARAEGSGAEKTYDWGVAYYMSYDNNLESCGRTIIDAIRRGVASDRAVAAVQADFSDPGGMRRLAITAGGIEETRIPREDSASEDAAIEYLAWFVKTFPCKRYVFTFLDHGGTLDAMCYDERPGPGGRTWMSGRVLGEKLRAFRAGVAGRVELLFLQQCGRGSLENLYSFRGTAEFVMSSPVPVGAPNTYYAALHRWLGEGPEASGAEVAARIAAADRDYTVYTCARGEKLAELPARLDAAIALLLEKDALVAGPELPAIHPVGEPIVDAAAYLRGLAAANGAGEAEVAAFFAWVRSDLFTAPAPWRPARARAGRDLCGLGIFAPRSAREARRYAHLDLLRESRLAELWKKVTAPTAGAGGGGARLFSR